MYWTFVENYKNGLCGLSDLTAAIGLAFTDLKQTCYREPIEHNVLVVLDEPVPGRPTHITIPCGDDLPTKRELKIALAEMLDLDEISFTISQDADRYRGTVYDDREDSDDLYDFKLFPVT